jgi:hypothetical protein
MHVNKVFVGLNTKEETRNLTVFVDFKRKNVSLISKKILYIQLFMVTRKGK